MIDGLFASANYEGVKKMLDASVLRQEAISSNIANVETPHYKRIDVNSTFGAELKRAIASSQSGDVRSVQPRIEVDQAAVAQNRDGNSVQLEKELVHLQKNMIAHQLQTKMITGKLTSLRKAISGNA
jgi:flagellar basal-body rod protein FlgB